MARPKCDTPFVLFVCLHMLQFFWCFCEATKCGYPREGEHALAIFGAIGWKTLNPRETFRLKGWMNGLLLKSFIGWVMCVYLLCCNFVNVLWTQMCVCVCFSYVVKFFLVFCEAKCVYPIEFKRCSCYIWGFIMDINPREGFWFMIGGKGCCQNFV